MPSLTLYHPQPNDTLKIGDTLVVTGQVTDRGGPDPAVIESVVVSLDGQPPVEAQLTPIKGQKLTTVNFAAEFPVTGPAGPHSLWVTATNDADQRDDQDLTFIVADPDTHLQRMTVTFHTHNDNRDPDTVLHVFVKNRSSSTATPEGSSSYIANLMEWRRLEQLASQGRFDHNPFLGYAQALAPGLAFEDGSTFTFDIPLRTQPVPMQEIELPTLSVHILPYNNDRWIFDYEVSFHFADGRSFAYSSKDVGLQGVILDQDNRDHSGLCTENPFRTPLPPPAPFPSAQLVDATLKFYTHDDDKSDDTRLDIQVFDRRPGQDSRVLAAAFNALAGQSFDDRSLHEISLPLQVQGLHQNEITLPVVQIDIQPTGTFSVRDRWIFDYQLVLTFNDGRVYTSQTNGVILDQDNRRHLGAYQGAPFPTAPQPGKPAMNVHAANTLQKDVPLAFVRAKLDEFINERQDPPLFKLLVDNAGVYGDTFPENFYSLQSLVADPPPPGTVTGAGFDEGVAYVDAPASLGQFNLSSLGGAYIRNLRSSSIRVTLDTTQPLPLMLEIDFDTAAEGCGVTATLLGDLRFKYLTMRMPLSLDMDPARNTVDVLSWAGGVRGDQDLIEVNLELDPDTADLSGWLSHTIHDKIHQQLTGADHFGGLTLREKINAMVTSWLVGGSTEGATPCRVTDVSVHDDTLSIAYTGPSDSFDFAPATPADWPAGVDFTPGNLAGIDHIVVLTMENRSFDSMLGYLSLPPERGGEGRADIDGLRGDESNPLDGKTCPSFAFAPGETIFAPDPPHSHDPVQRAIAGGAMSGFVQSFADEHGPELAPRIMGYHTGINVPSYDALARDFAVCDRWFSSHPGPTFCNRFYELTGRLNIDPDGFWEFSNSSALRPSFTPTIFDKLGEQGVSWKYYEDRYCYLRFFQKHTFDTTNIVSFDDPVAGFAAAARDGTLPSVSFIDPHFIELPPGANCDGAPADVSRGQALVRSVVEAVVAGPKWDRTLLVIVYDEHGGFYDHVAPPAAPWVTGEDEPITTLGVRVPMLLVSPRVAAGSAFGSGRNGGPALHFDHTSILKTIVRRFLNAQPPYLGPRFAAASDLSSVLSAQARSSALRPFIGHHLLYEASQMRLQVQGGAGAGVQQAAAGDDPAQEFSFEDAGGGLYYLRTCSGNLYLTSDDGETITPQRKRLPSDPGGSAAALRQLWSLTAAAGPAQAGQRCTVRNAAFPARTLQPTGGSTDAGAAVVLGDPVMRPGEPVPNPWLVTMRGQSEVHFLPTVSSAQADYRTADMVTVIWSDMAGNPKDWVAIAPEGAAPDAVSRWAYTGGAPSGQAAFGAAGLAPGRYVARAYVDDSYTIVAESAVFTISEMPQAQVSTDLAAYAPGQPIRVSWSNLAVDASNWVGYAPEGSPDMQVTRWAAAGGSAAGSVTLEGTTVPGRYVARAFANGTYVKAGESAVFVVG